MAALDGNLERRLAGDVDYVRRSLGARKAEETRSVRRQAVPRGYVQQRRQLVETSHRLPVVVCSVELFTRKLLLPSIIDD